MNSAECIIGWNLQSALLGFVGWLGVSLHQFCLHGEVALGARPPAPHQVGDEHDEHQGSEGAAHGDGDDVGHVHVVAIIGWKQNIFIVNQFKGNANFNTFG